MMKDTVWYELFDRMNDYDCPVCKLIETRLESLMQSIMYEGVNDSEFRKNVMQAEGFCNTHAYQLMAMGDPLGHAIIYIDLMEEGIKRISNNKQLPNSLKVKRKTQCPFCISVKKGEQIYVDHFADCISDDDFFEKYSQHGILCLNHYAAVYDKIINTNLKEMFREKTLFVYSKLTNDLKEIKRKNDYRYTSESWTSELKTAWQKAVMIINGYPGMS